MGKNAIAIPTGMGNEIGPIKASEVYKPLEAEVVEEEPDWLKRADVRRLIKKSYRVILKDCLLQAAAERGKHLIQHAVERAYEDDVVLIALIKKIVPDKLEIEGGFSLSKEDRADISSRLIKMAEMKRGNVGS